MSIRRSYLTTCVFSSSFLLVVMPTPSFAQTNAPVVQSKDLPPAQVKLPPPQVKALQNLATSAASMKNQEEFEGCIESTGAMSFQPRIVACTAALSSPALTDANRALVLYRRAELYRATHDEFRATADFSEALGIYDRLIVEGTPAPALLQQRGSSAHALGYRDRALSDYDQVIQLDPTNARVLINRGILLARDKHDYVRAIADLDKALALAPNDEDALMARGEAYGDSGDTARALADLDRAIQLAPDRANAYLLRGIVSGRRGDQVSALADYDKAATLDPGNAEALVNRAAVRSTRGDQDGAIVDLDAAIALQPNDPVANYNRGYAYFAKGDYDRAIQNYTSAIRADPNMAMAYNNRCMTRVIAGIDTAQALDDCDLALSKMPDSLESRATRGFVYLKLGKPAMALVEYDAALKLSPRRPLALYGRGLARIKLGSTVDGEADRAAARALAPGIESQFSSYGLN